MDFIILIIFQESNFIYPINFRFFHFYNWFASISFKRDYNYQRSSYFHVNTNDINVINFLIMIMTGITNLHFIIITRPIDHSLKTYSSEDLINLDINANF